VLPTGLAPRNRVIKHCALPQLPFYCLQGPRLSRLPFGAALKKPPGLSKEQVFKQL